MAVLEIVMIVIGIGAVFLSFKASDSNINSSKEEADRQNLKDISQEVKEALEQFDRDLQEKANEVINSTDDKLSAMLNEKIMGLSEYSQQILDKMQNNHSETVFLYDMLNEKEKDIKELVHNADITKAEIRDELANKYQEFKKNIEEIDEVNAKVQTIKVDDGIPDELLYSSIDNNDIDNSDGGHSSMYDEEIAKIEEQEQQEQKEKVLHKLYDNMGISGIDAVAIETGIEHVNHSDEIIDLYNKGHSILDISKMLEIGQGEAKFVIDMYKAE